LIGYKGVNVNRIKQESGCGVYINPHHLKVYITSTGMYRVHKAVQLIADTVSRAPAVSLREHSDRYVVDLPPQLTGLLIGSGGSTIKYIREMSGAFVLINHQIMKVIVTGTPQRVLRAAAMVEAVLSFGSAVNSSPTTPYYTGKQIEAMISNLRGF
jgi:rRNA processing protein Krr1/Pno1